MNTLTIELSDPMMKVVRSQVGPGNFQDPSSFVQFLIADFTKRKRQEIEAKLLEAVEDYENGRFEEVTPEFWQKLREGLINPRQSQAQP